MNYAPTFNAFKKNDDLNYWRHFSDLNVWKDFTRSTKLEIRNTYLRSNDPRDSSPALGEDAQQQESVIEADKNRTDRHEYASNISQIRLSHQFGADNNSIYGAYSYSVLREIDTFSEVPLDSDNRNGDRNIATPAVGLIYNFSPTWGIEIENEYAISNYKEENDRKEYNGNIRLVYHSDRALSGFLNYRHTILDYHEDLDEDYRIYEPSIGIAYEFQDNTRIVVGVGYYIQDFKTSKDENGVNITSDISKRWIYQNGYLGLTGGSGYVIDDDGTRDNGLDIYYFGRVEVGYNFTSRLLGSVYEEYRHDEYPDETPDREEKMMTSGLDISWQALEWMGVGLTYEFNDLSSNRVRVDDDSSYTENRAILTLRIAPVSSFRLN